jgi:glutamyl-tRNA synthetase/nondiscriminating glutamyl-tRNA synthetase
VFEQPSNGSEIPAFAPERANPFIDVDVLEILKENNWAAADTNENQMTWCARAAAILGPQVSDRAALADLLRLVFEYDARAILKTMEAHVVMSRYAARDVLRQLALLLLEEVPLTNERFSEIITRLKEGLDIRGRELFHPIRLMLAGRSGEGELDRVILLLEEAAAAGFAAPVKAARERILEFCSVFE